MSNGTFEGARPNTLTAAVNNSAPAATQAEQLKQSVRYGNGLAVTGMSKLSQTTFLHLLQLEQTVLAVLQL
jgi:hypothetical protein